MTLAHQKLFTKMDPYKLLEDNLFNSKSMRSCILFGDRGDHVPPSGGFCGGLGSGLRGGLGM